MKICLPVPAFPRGPLDSRTPPNSTVAFHLGRFVVQGVAFLLLAAHGFAAPSPTDDAWSRRFARYDQPFRGESIALSPDGTHLAYSEMRDGQLWLMVADLDQHTRKELKLAEDHTAASRQLAIEADARTLTYPFLHAERKWIARGQLRTLQWAGPSRLLFQGSDSGVFAYDLEKNAPVLLWDRNDSGSLTPSQVGPGQLNVLPARVLPGPPEDIDHVLIQASANTQHATPANVYRVNVRTGESKFAGTDQRFGAIKSWSARDGSLFDRRGWLRLDYWRESERREPIFYYQEPQSPEPPDSDIVPSTLDRFLGQPKKTEFTLSPRNYFGERSFPLAFGYSPNILYVASNVGRDTRGIVSLNVATKERHFLTPASLPYDLYGFEPHFPDESLVFDEARQRLVGVRATLLKSTTYWFDPDLAKFQISLEKTFTGQTVEIIQWDNARERFLLRLSKEDEPGQYVLFTRKDQKMEIILERSSGLTDEVTHPSAAFIFTSAAGIHLSGYITFPRKPKLTPPPLVVYCEGGPWTRAMPGFHREAQGLAELGVIVLRLNYRGSSGFGRTFLRSFEEGPGNAAVDDILAGIDWLSTKYKIERKRIAIVGVGFGGYVATRALQLRPDLFRCAIGIDSVIDLPQWGKIHPVENDSAQPYGDGPVAVPSADEAQMAAQSAPEADDFTALFDHHSSPTEFKNPLLDFGSEVRHEYVQRIHNVEPPSPPLSPEQASRPILLIENAWDPRRNPEAIGQHKVEFSRVPGDFKTGTPQLRAQVYSQIDAFLNLTLYGFKVEVGTPVKAEDSDPTPNSSRPDRGQNGKPEQTP